MKRLLLLATAIGLSVMMQGCAIYASPYGYSTGYYGYAPYYGFGYNYWPHSYYSYRPHHHFGGGPGYRDWGRGHQGWGHGGWRHR
jgi:hypothetical protein